MFQLHFQSWGQKEEDLLVNLRHDMEEDFKDKKSHLELWEEIAKNMHVAGYKTSAQQAKNKYFSLKKCRRR
jgi:hypothetical protein